MQDGAGSSSPPGCRGRRSAAIGAAAGVVAAAPGLAAQQHGLGARQVHAAMGAAHHGLAGGVRGGTGGLGARRALAGPWRFRTAAVDVAMDEGKNQVDTALYNAMVHPLQPYPLAGVIWYQGETNATPQGAHAYRDRFGALIRGWRAAWQAPELPFLWAQLAAFGSGGDRVDAAGTVIDSPWATLRESQSAVLALPATAQAVTIDVGDAHDIHPRDKRTVGHRLALAARRVAYGQDVVHAGPAYRGAEAREGTLVLRFDAPAGLAVRGGGQAPRGFELAGADGRFHPAQARIEGDAVVLRSGAVPQPRLARYAWSDNPAAADLVGGDGLPASPFRTGEW